MWRKPCGKKNIVGFFIFCFSVAVVVVVILFTDPHISLRNKLQYISALKVQWRWCWPSSLRMQGPETQIESPLTLGKLIFFFLTLVLWPHHLVPFLQLNYQRNTMFTNPVQMLNISQSIKKKKRDHVTQYCGQNLQLHTILIQTCPEMLPHFLSFPSGLTSIHLYFCCFLH